MHKTTDSTAEVIQAYRHRAKRYHFTVSLFNLFHRLGFDLEGWRGEAIRALALKRGDTVVDIGCGTGLNFWLLEQAVGPEGKIIGVDVSEAMLAQAHQRVVRHGPVRGTETPAAGGQPAAAGCVRRDSLSPQRGETAPNFVRALRP